MKKYFVLFLTLLFGYMSAFAAYIKDYPVTLTQPDGSVLNCFASGDEFYNWYHDENDFTIIADAEGFYCYAIVSDDEVVASEYKVGSVDPASVGIAPNVHISAEKRMQIRNDFLKNTKEKPDREGFNPVKSNSNFGTMNNLVVYITFSDQSPFDKDTSFYWNMFNQDISGGEQTLKNYFEIVSYNQFSINSHFYPVSDDGFIVSYQDENPREYYMPYSESNPRGYRDEGERMMREHKLLHDAIVYIEDMVPDDLDLDYDNDGYVDNVVFIVRGDVTAWATLLWPHCWSLYTNYAYINGLQVWDFNLQVEVHLDASKASVLCHEMFHSLGSPDLYRYNDNTIDPVGNWDVMSGNTSPAQSMASYMKYKYGGWIDEIPEITEGGVYHLNTPYAKDNNMYKIASPNSKNEFFLLEYRNKKHQFESKIPGEGLLIYRINPSLNGNADGPPDEVYIFRPGGYNTTTNGNLSQAAFSADVNRTMFNDSTNPPCFLKDNSPGGIYIKNIGSSEETISFEVWMGGIPDADFTASDTNVTVNGAVDFYATTFSFVDHWFWDFQDATPSSSEEQNPTDITFNSPGYKSVTLTVMNEYGDKSIVKQDYIYVSDSEIPVVNYAADKNIICMDDNVVHFYDSSSFSPTAWNWSFEPNTVTFVENTDQYSENPVVQFDEMTDYALTLTVTNAYGSSNLSVENVVSSKGLNPEDYFEDFENISSLSEAGWSVVNPDNNVTWRLGSSFENFEVNKAAFMDLFNYSTIDQEDHLISPPFNLNDSRYYILNFEYAYRLRNADVSDTLIVSVSTDCGASWNEVGKFFEDGTGSFATDSPMSSPFYPYYDYQWCNGAYNSQCIYIDLAEYAGNDNVLIRFTINKIIGNNFFLDNISFNGYDGIDEMENVDNCFSVYPNPTNDKFILNCDNICDDVRVIIYNLYGKLVAEFDAQSSVTEFDLTDYPSGMYIINVICDEKTESLKLIKQ